MGEQAPISRLLAHTQNHRSTMWLATLFSILNKIFDLAPPLLIGAAVDVVIKKEESALADFGYSDPKEQLILLSVLTIIIWVFESLFEYIYGVLWRNLAQTVQHELRLDAYSHIQNLEMEWFGDQSKGELMSMKVIGRVIMLCIMTPMVFINNKRLHEIGMTIFFLGFIYTIVKYHIFMV